MRLADYSQTVTVDQLDAALRAGQFEGVAHYMAGTPGWVIRIEDPAVVDGIRTRGWPQFGIDVPRSPSDVNGAATAVVLAQTYGCPAGFVVYLDVEPVVFALDAAGWAAAADRWCDDIRTAGFSPGPYGNDATVAACGSRANTIWRAKPGQCDPAGPGLADAFMAGRRIVQCGSGAWGGVEMDVNYSQFAIGGAVASFPASDQAESEVDLAYMTMTGHGAPTAADREYWAQIALTQGLQSMVDGIATSVEAQQHQADQAKMLALFRAGAFTSGPGPAGPPGPAPDTSTLATKADLEQLRTNLHGV